MLRFEPINLAVILFSFLLPVTGCQRSASQVASQQQPQKDTTANSSQEKGNGERAASRERAAPTTQDKTGPRVAIPDIKGCSRDDTTFFSGEVPSFKSMKGSLEITVHTDWNTVVKLVQPKDSPEVIFRRDGKDLASEDLRELQATLQRGDSKYRATVWVCRQNGQKIIKLVDWTAAEGAAKLPGSAP